MDLAKQLSSPLKIRAGRGGVLHLSGSAVAGVSRPGLRMELIDRLFAVPTLQSLRINGSEARLRFQSGRTRLSETMEAMAAAMRKPVRDPLPLAGGEVVFSALENRAVEIRRVGQRLTFWRIDEAGPASWRCFHPLILHEGIREQVLEDLATLAGIREESASRWLPGCVVVRCRPQKITPEHLLDVLEPAILRSVHLWHHVTGDFSPRRAIINTHAIIAPVSDYLLPQFRSVSAVLLFPDHLAKSQARRSIPAQSPFHP